MEKELPRLQKTLAAAGVASRRACEALIAEGRVTVNGKVVREMGAKPDPDVDDIRVDAQPIRKQEKQKPLYIMLNKPLGYTSTVSDPHAERTVLELMLQVEERIYPVGRLDVDSEGMLLLTNDGEFANRLTHPRYHVPKLYRVRARGFVGRAAATRLAEGVELEDGNTAPAEVQYIEYDTATQSTIIEITLYEGRNRQVRRMFEQVGHPVRQLTRIGFGSLRLQNLNPGTWRKLRSEEVDALLALAKPTATPPKSARRVKSTAPYRPRNAGKIEEEKRRRGEEETGEGIRDKGFREQGTGNREQDKDANGGASFTPHFTKNVPGDKTGFNDGYAPVARPVFKPDAASRVRPAPGGKFVRPAGKPPVDRPATPAASNGADRSVPPAGSRPMAGRRPFTGSKPTDATPPPANPAFAVGHPRFADPLNNPLLKARPAKFMPARPKTDGENSGQGKAGKRGKGKGKSKYVKPNNPYATANSPYPTPNTQRPAGVVDFSSNSAKGRKAGVPFQPRPKQGHRAFGRAKP